jgi:hypothetical protein
VKKVLFLASNPTGTPNLEINYEIRQARNSLQRSEFEIDTWQAVRYDDLRKALTQVKPRIVHFSGHGSGFQGLVLEDDEGQSRLISNKVLAGLFGIPSIYQSVECIVLNACFFEVQAKAICKNINYVIGMNREVRDDAAIAFTKGFYDALGDGESIENAFQFGKNAFEEELSSTTSKHRGMEVVPGESDTVDSVVQILKKDPPFVPFVNGSVPKAFPSQPVPPKTSPKLKIVGLGVAAALGLFGIWAIRHLPPILIPQPSQPQTFIDSGILKGYAIRIYFLSNRVDLEVKAKAIRNLFDPGFRENNVFLLPRDNSFFEKYSYPNPDVNPPANELRYTPTNIDGVKYLEKILKEKLPAEKFHSLPIGSASGKYVSIFLGP